MNMKANKNSLQKKMRWSARLLLAGFLLGSLLPMGGRGVQAAPNNANALDIVINEVAWAGTEAYAGDEWIELYNPNSYDVDIENWILTNENEDFYISFTVGEEIQANSYFLMERGNGNATSVDQQKTYNHNLLSDAGETLYLLDNTRKIIDTANKDGGAWPNGRITPASSMERMSENEDTDSNWITNTIPSITASDAAGKPIYGTPGEVYWGYPPTSTPIPTMTFTITPTGSVPTNHIFINEVAWMGTNASSSDEWIELYNPTTSDVSLEGWHLKAQDGTPNIALLGTIPAGGYFLLERTDDTTVSDVAADLIYSGALGNKDEILYLYDNDSTPVLADTANKENGGTWPAGDNTSKSTMERISYTTENDSVWTTNGGTTRNGLDADGNPINGTPHSSGITRPTATVSPTRTKTPIPPTKTPTPFPYQSVVLNEVLARPAHDWNGDGAVNVYDEFIEIINRGTTDINLQGWKLDDEYNQGSSIYVLPNTILLAGERTVVFGDVSGISLSDGGDSVRLLKSNNQIADVITYTIIKNSDESWCRYPENASWQEHCFPTPSKENALYGSFDDSLIIPAYLMCLVPDTVPTFISSIECGDLGMHINNPTFWNNETWIKILTGHAKHVTWVR